MRGIETAAAVKAAVLFFREQHIELDTIGYPEKVLCTQYPSTRCSTHFFPPAR